MPEFKQSMRATIMYRNSYDGGDGWTFYPMTVNISTCCPQCGEPRGSTTTRRFCEDGEWFDVDTWENACGHVDRYHDVYQESKSFDSNGSEPTVKI
ncbi:MAG: hypothetical protein HAW67_04680 [Endozoicomonadaceae bacterium]|nr:hypothetical protein [Endozoicomonadaceae bacterium]